MDLTISKTEAEQLVNKCTTGIDYLLKRIKDSDGINKQDYEILGALDDLIIEFQDVYTTHLRIRNLYQNVLKEKRVAKQNEVKYNENKGGI